MHLSISRRGSNIYISRVSLPLVFVCIVTRERFGLAHAPHLFTKAFEHSYLTCKSGSRVFDCLVSRECFRLAHAPLLFTKAFELSCLVCKPSSCVFICLVTWGAFQACPCTSPFSQRHLNFRNLCVSLPLVCSFVLWLGVDSGLSMNLFFSQNFQTFVPCVSPNSFRWLFRLTIRTHWRIFVTPSMKVM